MLAYVFLLPKMSGKALIAAAALSAAGLPFLLPSMHERFFILADVLVFLYAWANPNRNTIIAAVLMQVASALPVAAWAFSFQHGELCAPFFAVGALLLIWKEVGVSHNALSLPAALPGYRSIGERPSSGGASGN